MFRWRSGEQGKGQRTTYEYQGQQYCIKGIQTTCCVDRQTVMSKPEPDLEQQVCPALQQGMSALSSLFADIQTAASKGTLTAPMKRYSYEVPSPAQARKAASDCAKSPMTSKITSRQI